MKTHQEDQYPLAQRGRQEQLGLQGLDLCRVLCICWDRHPPLTGCQPRAHTGLVLTAAWCLTRPCQHTDARLLTLGDFPVNICLTFQVLLHTVPLNDVSES